MSPLVYGSSEPISMLGTSGMRHERTEPVPWQLPQTRSGGDSAFASPGGNWLSPASIQSSLRSKLILVGASASIAALSLVAIVAFLITKDAVSDSVMNGLSAVATSQNQQLGLLFDHYAADVDKISSDTQVRQSLRHLIATGDHVDRFVLNQILTDRASAGEDGESLDIHNLDGEIVASSEPGNIGSATYDPAYDKFVINIGPVDSRIDTSDIRFSQPIHFDSRVIGYITVHHNADSLNKIVSSYVGSRDTGESLLVARDSNGDARFVTGLRFNGGEFYSVISEDNIDRAEVRALTMASGSGTDLIDYRGKQVFGVYNYIESAGIGLVVKMDADEALSRLSGLSRSLTLVIFFVSVLIVVGAIVIARYLLDPISRLTSAAEQFSRGSLNARVAIESGDEIGTLGHTFNVMAESIQASNNDLEVRVKERTADLQRSNQDLEQFAYVASHDLQEPLRMVSSYTQLLSRRYSGKLDSDADEFIGFAVDGAKRMQTLINDLLTYSRSGRATNNLSEISATEVVEEAVVNLGSRVENAGTVITIDDLPDVVADKQQLVSIFQNLISNSIKYRSATRDSQVRVSAQRVDKAWRFSITDNGIGIDSAFTDRIFTIFQRLHGREEYPGTGIGLAVVKKVVDRSGGSIWVESTVDKGSTFNFTIVDRESDDESSHTDERSKYRAAS